MRFVEGLAFGLQGFFFAPVISCLRIAQSQLLWISRWTDASLIEWCGYEMKIVLTLWHHWMPWTWKLWISRIFSRLCQHIADLSFYALRANTIGCGRLLCSIRVPKFVHLRYFNVKETWEVGAVDFHHLYYYSCRQSCWWEQVAIVVVNDDGELLSSVAWCFAVSTTDAALQLKTASSCHIVQLIGCFVKGHYVQNPYWMLLLLAKSEFLY